MNKRIRQIIAKGFYIPAMPADPPLPLVKLYQDKTWSWIQLKHLAGIMTSLIPTVSIAELYDLFFTQSPHFYVVSGIQKNAMLAIKGIFIHRKAIDNLIVIACLRGNWPIHRIETFWGIPKVRERIIAALPYILTRIAYEHKYGLDYRIPYNPRARKGKSYFRQTAPIYGMSDAELIRRGGRIVRVLKQKWKNSRMAEEEAQRMAWMHELWRRKKVNQ